MSGSGPYAEGGPYQFPREVPPGGMLVFGVVLAGWQWPLRLCIDREGDEIKTYVVCGRGACREPVLELNEKEARDWPFEPLYLATLAGDHLPECTASASRRRN